MRSVRTIKSQTSKNPNTIFVHLFTARSLACYKWNAAPAQRTQFFIMKFETIGEKNGPNNGRISLENAISPTKNGKSEKKKVGLAKMNNENNNPIHASDEKNCVIWIFHQAYTYIHALHHGIFFSARQSARTIFGCWLNLVNAHTNGHTASRIILFIVVLHVVFDSLSRTRSFLWKCAFNLQQP